MVNDVIFDTDPIDTSIGSIDILVDDLSAPECS